MLTDYFSAPPRPERSGTVACLFDKTGASLEPFRARGRATVNVRGRTDRALRRLVEVEDLGLVLAFARCPQLSPAGARWWRRKRAEDADFQEREKDELRRLETGLVALGAPFLLVLPCSAQIRGCFKSKTFTTSPHRFGGHLPDTPHPTYPDIVPARDAFQKRMLVVYNRLPRPLERPVEPVWQTRSGKRVSPLFARRTKRHVAARKLPPLGLVTALAAA